MMMIGAVDSDLMMRRTSSPASWGSIRSRSTRDGPRSRNRSTALVPSTATTTWNPSRTSEYCTLSARAGSSSTTRTSGSFPLRGRRWVRGVGELTELPGQKESNLLGDVNGVIADPFQLPCHHIHADPPLQLLGVRGQADDLLVHPPIQLVHGIVHLGELQAQLEVPLHERFDRGAEHLSHDVGHLLEVAEDGGVRGQVHRGQGQLRDVDGLVPDALEVQVHVHDHEHESEVGRHGSLESQDVEDPSLDVEVPAVDL